MLDMCLRPRVTEEHAGFLQCSLKVVVWVGLFISHIALRWHSPKVAGCLLHSTFNDLRTELTDNPSGEVVGEYDRTKDKLHQLMQVRVQFPMFCTQAK